MTCVNTNFDLQAELCRGAADGALVGASAWQMEVDVLSVCAGAIEGLSSQFYSHLPQQCAF